ncbi:WD40 repeat domain-containing protein [Limnoglobus roseus]|uniref:WD-40 repeat protein n=1 Tax=Limnoglobus roseus TaxID=2598579 RepID=A0A5C1A5N3_9BACT|nr:WD40 repeat domain-containing protein [Limnoglobus roseus]QEL13663.1 WD-40 repeat protein [Limnoglobus roseus]
MRFHLALLLTLMVGPLSAADPVVFGHSTHFRTSPNSTIVELTFSPDGKTVLAGHTQRLGITAWDAATGNRKWTADLNRELSESGRLSMVVPMHLLAVGTEVVTLEAAADGKFRVVRFDLETGRRTGELALPSHGRVEEFRFSPDGRRLAYHEGETCFIIDAKTGRDVWALPIGRDSAFKRSIAFAPDGNTLSVAGVDRFETYNLRSGGSIAKSDILNDTDLGGNWALEYSPNGKWLMAQKTEEGMGSAWIFEGATKLHRPLGRSILKGRATFSPDSAKILAATPQHDDYKFHDRNHGMVGCYDFQFQQPRLKRDWLCEIPRHARCITYSPDGKTIAVATKNAITLLDATGNRLPQSADRVGGFTVTQSSRPGEVVTLADDIETWDVRTGMRTRILPAPAARGRWAALSLGGRFAAWEVPNDAGATLELWDVPAEKKIAGPVPCGMFTAFRGLTTDGRVMSIGPGDERDSRILRMSHPAALANVKPLAYSPAYPTPITEAVVSADTRTVVVQHGPVPGLTGDTDLMHRVQLHWHDTAGRKIGETDWSWCDTPPILAVSADGGLVALSDIKPITNMAGDVIRTEHGVNLFAVRPGGGQKPAFRFVIPRKPRLMAFSPDARTVAIVFEGGTTGYRAALYETSSGILRQDYALPDVGQALAFTPDGSHLVVATADGPGVAFDLWATREPFDAAKSWAKLFGPDGEQAFAAMRTMVANPDASVALLRDKVKPLPIVGEMQLAAWLAALEAPAFADRESAMKELREVLIDFRGILEAELKTTPSVEARERLEKILKQSDAVGGELLRQYRAVEVLARIGSPESRAVLAHVATGDPSRRLNAMAKKAVAK